LSKNNDNLSYDWIHRNDMKVKCENCDSRVLLINSHSFCEKIYADEGDFDDIEFLCNDCYDGNHPNQFFNKKEYLDMGYIELEITQKGWIVKNEQDN